MSAIHCTHIQFEYYEIRFRVFKTINNSRRQGKQTNNNEDGQWKLRDMWKTVLLVECQSGGVLASCSAAVIVAVLAIGCGRIPQHLPPLKHPAAATPNPLNLLLLMRLTARTKPQWQLVHGCCTSGCSFVRLGPTSVMLFAPLGTPFLRVATYDPCPSVLLCEFCLCVNNH